jgi:maltose O-acetyltransferase
MWMFSALRKIWYAILKFKKTRYIDGLINKGLLVGKNVWFVDTFFLDPSHCYLISIGDNTTICPNVRMIAHDASTKRHLGYTKIGKIDIKENCFIGDSSIVLPNVTIGPNTIIGAGSVVTKSIPPDMVAAGNPARPICSLAEYLSKIRKQVQDGKRVFGKEHTSDCLDKSMRKELVSSVENGIGFII